MKNYYDDFTKEETEAEYDYRFSLRNQISNKQEYYQNEEIIAGLQNRIQEFVNTLIWDVLNEVMGK